MTFCIRLRRLMLARGMSQADIARKMGVSRSCVHGWYWGPNEPNIDTLKRLRRVLNCTWDDLLGE